MRLLLVLFIVVSVGGEAAGDWITDFSTFDAPAYILEANAPDCAVWDSDQQCFCLTSNENYRWGLIVQQGVSAYTNREARHRFAEFTAEFDFRIAGTADGIIFVWSEEPLAGRGHGGYLHWTDGSGYGVEIDCFDNGPHDPSAAHIALMHDGIHNHLAYINMPSIQDGNWHTIGVFKSGDYISVSYDGGEVFNHTLVDDEVASGRFRFSAGTGQLTAAQYLDNIHIVCEEQSVGTQGSTWSALKRLYK